MTAANPRFTLPLLFLLVSVIYLPGLPGPFMLDDRNNLAPLEAIENGTLSTWNFISGQYEGGLFRPLSVASFVANWWLWGDNLLAFKAVNLFIHLLCGLAVFFLARVLLRIVFTQLNARVIDGGAMFACAMWLLAPLLVSTVLYTVQRMAQLSTLFTLLGLICYAHGRQRSSSPLIVLALAVMWPLAVLSKENGALLPLLAALIEWWLPNDSAAQAHTRRWRIVLIVIISLAALTLSAKMISDPQWLLAGYQGRDFTIGQRIMSQGSILFDYLGNLLLAPGSSPMGVFRDDYASSKTLWEPKHTWLSALLWLCLLSASVYFRTRHSVLRALGFGVLFFVCAHLVESTVFALELYFEHRNYLPAFGVFFALTSGGLWMRNHVRAHIVGTLAVVLVLGCALFTAQRTLLWGNEANLYAHAARTHPNSARAWLGLASVQFADQQFDAARVSLTHAARIIGPTSFAAIALQEIAAHCVANRQVSTALWQQLRDAPSLGPDLLTINALAWTAGAVHTGICSASDRARLQQLVAEIPRTSTAWNPSRQRLRDQHIRYLLRAPP